MFKRLNDENITDFRVTKVFGIETHIIFWSKAYGIFIKAVDIPLSWKYDVTILKVGIETMIPENVCKGRVGSDKRVWAEWGNNARLVLRHSRSVVLSFNWECIQIQYNTNTIHESCVVWTMFYMFGFRLYFRIRFASIVFCFTLLEQIARIFWNIYF